MATRSSRRRHVAGRSRTTARRVAERVSENGQDGDAVDSRENGTDRSPADGPVADGGGGRRRLPGRRAVVVLLSAAAVLCGGAAVGFGVAAHGMRSGTSENRALVDARATREVAQQTSEAIRTAFSYDHADPATTRDQAQRVLIGDAVQQYNRLFAQVERLSAEEGLLFSTTVRSAGVTRLVGDRAELLVFVDQQGVRANSPERRSGSAQLGLTAQRVGAEWKISRVDVL